MVAPPPENADGGVFYSNNFVYILNAKMMIFCIKNDFDIFDRIAAVGPKSQYGDRCKKICVTIISIYR